MTFYHMIESHEELRVKSVEDMVNLIESHVVLRVKSVLVCDRKSCIVEGSVDMTVYHIES